MGTGKIPFSNSCASQFCYLAESTVSVELASKVPLKCLFHLSVFLDTWCHCFSKTVDQQEEWQGHTGIWRAPSTATYNTAFALETGTWGNTCSRIWICVGPHPSSYFLSQWEQTLGCVYEHMCQARMTWWLGIWSRLCLLWPITKTAGTHAVWTGAHRPWCAGLGWTFHILLYPDPSCQSSSRQYDCKNKGCGRFFPLSQCCEHTAAGVNNLFSWAS